MHRVSAFATFAALLLLAGQGRASGDTSSVYFPFNQAALTATMTRQLDSALVYGPLNRPGLFLIYGHTDALGTDGYNLGLSRKRALAVKALLLSRGVAETEIRILTGMGEQAAGEAAAPDSRPQDRRVDVILQHSTASPAAEAPQRFSPEPEDMLPGKRKAEATSLSELVAGESLVLKNVYFFPGRHVVKPESYPELDKLLEILQARTTMVIRIEGHVCCVGPGPGDALDNDTRRVELSVNRALTIRSMLIDRGIAADRIQAVGFGYRYPIFRDESTEEQASANRRVEVRIIRL